MKNKFTFNKRTLLGYGVIVILAASIVISTYLNHQNNEACVSKQTSIASPALEKLYDLKNLLDRAALGTTLWFSEQKTEAPHKQDLLKLIETEYPNLKKEVQTLSVKWNTADKDSVTKILESTDSLLVFCTNNVINNLQTMDDYQDPTLYFILTENIEYINALNISLKKDVSKLIDQQKTDAASVSVSEEVSASFRDLEKVIILLTILLVVCAFPIVFWREQK